jgi:cytoskeletal protein RodZ
MKFLRVHGEAEDPGALLVLYPSIPFVLDGRDIEELFVTILADSDEEADEEADDEAGGKEESGVPDGIDSLDDPEGPADSEDIETIDDPENTPRRANAQGDTAAPAAPHASSAAAAPAAPHAPSAAPHNRRNP